MTQRNPALTVDIIIRMPGGGIVFIERANPPHGWALPGGFVDYGESVEHAAVREAFEETGLHVRLVRQFLVYSAPERDVRQHTVSVVLIADGDGTPVGADDARRAAVHSPHAPPSPLAFDHEDIVSDYRRWCRGDSLEDVFRHGSLSRQAGLTTDAESGNGGP